MLVPREAPQVRLIDEWDVMGMRPTVSWSVDIEEFPVAPEVVFGAPGSWVTNDPRTFTLGFAANHVGAAHGAFDFTCDWVRERPYLAGSDLTQHMLGEMASELFAARSALYAAAAVWEDGDHDVAELESIKARRCTSPSACCSRRRAVPSTSAAHRGFSPVPDRDDAPRCADVHAALPRRAYDARARPGDAVEGRFAAKRALDSSELPGAERLTARRVSRPDR